MSKQTVVEDTENQQTINTDLTKLFVWGKRFAKADYTNSGYEPVPLLAGTVMGRISASLEITPLESGASDGSETPVGILAQDVNIAEGATKEVNFLTEGDVVESKVLLQDADTLDTLIGGRTIRDLIHANTIGVRVLPTGDQLTGFDND